MAEIDQVSRNHAMPRLVHLDTRLESDLSTTTTTAAAADMVVVVVVVSE